MRSLLTKVGVAASALSLVFAFTPVFAQDVSRVRVAPAILQQRVSPGAKLSETLKVTNLEAVSRDFAVFASDIKGLTETGEPIFSETNVENYGVSSWITLGAKNVTVPAGETREVPFTIIVPESAGPGGHYGGVFVSYTPEKQALTGSGIGFQVGMLIDLRIAGNAIEEANIIEFSTDKSLYQGPAVNFTSRVANEGNVLLRPRGPIDIVNMFGKKVATVVMNDSNAAIFPGQERSFAASWSDSGLAIGRYDAVMSLGFGEDVKKTISSATSFWIIPVLPIALVLFGVIFFITLFTWSLKRYIRKKVEKLSGSQKIAQSDEEKFLYQAKLPFSRLMFVTVLTLIFTLVFLVALFMFFG
ncbi:MAG: hypothetical protein Q7S28_03305 [bacterium]|nr:hypothetical protein [bacterium]